MQHTASALLSAESVSNGCSLQHWLTCRKVGVHLRRHGALGSWILFIIICLFLFGPCCLACCLSAVIDALHRPRQDAMRNEALHTVQCSIHKLCLASLNRHSEHIQQLCSTVFCCLLSRRRKSTYWIFQHQKHGSHRCRIHKLEVAWTQQHRGAEPDGAELCTESCTRLTAVPRDCIKEFGGSA